MNYKFQTFISVISIAIGIVTLSLVHSCLTGFQLPSIYNQPFHNRAYNVKFESLNGEESVLINNNIIRAIKKDGELESAELIAVPVSERMGLVAKFQLPDSTIRKGQVAAEFIDPEYLNFAGFRSAITGEKITELKRGEAIIGEELAKKIFHDKSPIGAVQTQTCQIQPIPVTIVDVYQSHNTLNAKLSSHDILYYCVADHIEDQEGNLFITDFINVVLKKGFSEQQLEDELNAIVYPLGLKAELSKALNSDYVNEFFAIKALIYLVSSIILLVSIIGFLRIQSQLFRMRRREISLRIVNGANRMNLFGLLITEAAIPICLSVILAVWLGFMLQGFLDNELKDLLNHAELNISNLWVNSLVIGAGLLAVCSVMAIVTLSRICNDRNSLAASMRRSRNNILRNIVLGVQITVCIVFVCCTLIIVRGGKMILEAFTIPKNNTFYKEAVYLRPAYAQQPIRLIEEIKRLPDLDKMVMWGNYFSYVNEIKESPEAMDRFERTGGMLNFYQTTDTSFISLFGIDVEWLNSGINRNECLLICEKRYNEFQELGLLDKNTLTFGDMNPQESITLPIGGIIKSLPYFTNRNGDLIAISPYWKNRAIDYALSPKPGRRKALVQSINETIERLEPEIINDMVFKFLDGKSIIPMMIETTRTGVLILGCVSMVICAMSIFSAITLETRARRKEVAIRKVNGASNRDIFKLFGRVYIILMIASMVIAVPVCVIFNDTVETIILKGDGGNTLSPVAPIIAGCSITIGLIAAIVCRQIYRIIQTNPAEIIAKE